MKQPQNVKISKHHPSGATMFVFLTSLLNFQEVQGFVICDELLLRHDGPRMQQSFGSVDPAQLQSFHQLIECAASDCPCGIASPHFVFIAVQFHPKWSIGPDLLPIRVFHNVWLYHPVRDTDNITY